MQRKRNARMCLPGYPRNWRSFTEMQRKRNARMRLPGGSAQLAFIHWDIAEKERQFATAARAPAERPGLPAMSAGVRSLHCEHSRAPNLHGIGGFRADPPPAPR